MYKIFIKLSLTTSDQWPAVASGALSTLPAIAFRMLKQMENPKITCSTAKCNKSDPMLVPEKDTSEYRVVQ